MKHVGPGEVLAARASLVVRFGAEGSLGGALLPLGLMLLMTGVFWTQASKGRANVRQAVLELQAALEQRAGADAPPSR